MALLIILVTFRLNYRCVPASMQIWILEQGLHIVFQYHSGWGDAPKSKGLVNQDKNYIWFDLCLCLIKIKLITPQHVIHIKNDNLVANFWGLWGPNEAAVLQLNFPFVNQKIRRATLGRVCYQTFWLDSICPMHICSIKQLANTF